MAEGMTPEIHHVVACLLPVLGHLALWIGTFSRLHALGLRMWLLHLLELPIFAMLLGLPAAVLVQWTLDPPPQLDLESWVPGGALGRFYFWFCSVWGVVAIVTWCWRKWKAQPVQFLCCERQVESVAERLGRLPCRDPAIRLLARLPGNQILDLETNVKTLLVPRLPPSLDGLTIVHLSDLHFTGYLTEDFFQFVVDRVNQLDGDLVALTGDIIDERPCLGWIADVLGRVQSHLGPSVSLAIMTSVSATCPCWSPKSSAPAGTTSAAVGASCRSEVRKSSWRATSFLGWGPRPTCQPVQGRQTATGCCESCCRIHPIRSNGLRGEVST